MTDLIKIVEDAIWKGFEADDNACVDREMDLIDTGGTYETFNMTTIASGVVREFERIFDITTVEALDALPIPTPDKLSGTLIRASGYPAFGEVYERNTDGTWCLLQDPSGADWGQRQVPSKDIPLPAHILWVPPS